MDNILLKTKMYFGSFFAKRPTSKLTWCCEDYAMAKKWAKTQPRPFMKNKTLWEFVYDKYESVNTIDNVNKSLFNEI